MTQLELMHESLNDALRVVVGALGGNKTVGSKMRPELPIEQAAGWVRDCLNPLRREKFDPDQVLWLLREGRKVNCHDAAQFIARDCGYADVQPIEPEDEKAALQRMFNESVRQQGEILKRMERLAQPSMRSVA